MEQLLMKSVLYVSNLIFMFVGLLLLGVGITFEIKILDIAEVFEDNVSVVAMLTMVVGYILFLVAFFGFCGTIRKSNYMLVTYTIFMLMLLALKIALFTIIFVNLSRILGEIPRNIDRFFLNDKINFKNLEIKFQCCGTNGAVAYNGSRVSDTCCPSTYKYYYCSTEYAYGGCKDAVIAFSTSFAVVIAFFAILVAALQLVTVVIALCLAYSIRSKGRRAQY